MENKLWGWHHTLGEFHLQDPYRSKLSGILDEIVTVMKIYQLFNITLGYITISFDGLNALQNVEDISYKD